MLLQNHVHILTGLMVIVVDINWTEYNSVQLNDRPILSFFHDCRASLSDTYTWWILSSESSIKAKATQGLLARCGNITMAMRASNRCTVMCFSQRASQADPALGTKPWRNHREYLYNASPLTPCTDNSIGCCHSVYQQAHTKTSHCVHTHTQQWAFKWWQ